MKLQKKYIFFTIILLGYLVFMISGLFMHTKYGESNAYLKWVKKIQLSTRWYVGVPMFTHPKIMSSQVNYCFAFIATSDDHEKLVYKTPNEACKITKYTFIFDIYDFLIGLYLYTGMTRYWVDLAFDHNDFDYKNYFENFYKNHEAALVKLKGYRRSRYIRARREYIVDYTALGKHYCYKTEADSFSVVVRMKHYMYKQKKYQDSFHHFLQFNCKEQLIVKNPWKNMNHWRGKLWPGLD